MSSRFAGSGRSRGPQRSVRCRSSRATAFLLLLATCVAPDEIRTAILGGHTNYPSETSQFDSANYGAELSLAWDVGRRAQAHDAEIKLLEQLQRERAQAAASPPPKPATEDMLIKALVGLSALGGAGVWQGKNIAKGVRHIHAKVTGKQTPRDERLTRR